MQVKKDKGGETVAPDANIRSSNMNLHELSIDIDQARFDLVLLMLAQDGVYSVSDWIFAGDKKLLQVPNLGRKTKHLIEEAINESCISSLPISDKEKALLLLVPKKWLKPIIHEEVLQWFISRRRGIALRRSFAEEGGHISLRREVLDPDYLQEPFKSYVKAHIEATGWNYDD
jgi:hypothetical protein